MKVNEKDRRKNGCQMSKENLEIPASGQRVESHLRGARREVKAFDDVDGRQAGNRVPFKI